MRAILITFVTFCLITLGIINAQNSSATSFTMVFKPAGYIISTSISKPGFDTGTTPTKFTASDSNHFWTCAAKGGTQPVQSPFHVSEQQGIYFYEDWAQLFVCIIKPVAPSVTYQPAVFWIPWSASTGSPEHWENMTIPSLDAFDDGVATDTGSCQYLDQFASQPTTNATSGYLCLGDSVPSSNGHYVQAQMKNMQVNFGHNLATTAPYDLNSFTCEILTTQNYCIKV